jgi:hypothetical protein
MAYIAMCGCLKMEKLFEARLQQCVLLMLLYTEALDEIAGWGAYKPPCSVSDFRQFSEYFYR